MQRREFVLSTGAAAAAGLTGCLHGGGNGDDGNDTDNGDNGENGDNGGSEYTLVSEEPDYQGYFDGVAAYEDVGGTVDWTGESSVTVMAGDDEYTNQFVPAAIHVDQGTTVTWEWGTPGHNVVRAGEASGSTAAERADGVDTGSGDWAGDDSIETTGNTYENTFDEPGVYLYTCVPHDAQRMYGAVVVQESEGSGDGDGGMDGNQTDTDGNTTDTGGNETSE